MAAIVHNLPFFDHATTLNFRGSSVQVKQDQIIVWVSLGEKGLQQLHPAAPRFPAILDTGCNHNFVMRRRHLQEWAGIHPEYFGALKSTRTLGKSALQLAANVWLHPNRSGQRDAFADRQPFLLEVPLGIVVVTDTPESNGPRLPLLGLRALRWARLHVTLDCQRCRVTIRPPRRFWPFG